VIGRRRRSDERVLPIETALRPMRGRLHGLLGQMTKAFEGVERRRVMFVSPEHGDGTTTIAACAALMLIRHFRRDVALVEANLFSPALGGYLGIGAGPGLIDVLDGSVEPQAAVRNSKVDGLYVVTAGGQRESEDGELATARLRELIDQVSSEHRYTIVDAPPILEHPETCLLLEDVDEVFLVVRAGATLQERAREAIQVLEDAGISVGGVFLNRYRPHLPLGLDRWLR